METKLTSKQMSRIKYKLGFKCGVFVDRVGLGGDLALLLRSIVDVTLRSYSNNHIDVMVKMDNNMKSRRLTGFYREPVTSKGHITWQLLRQLAN